MASPYTTPVTESVKAPKLKVPDYCSKQKAPSNNVMTRIACPNSTIMALRDVEIGLCLRSPPVVLVAIYFVLLTSPPLAYSDGTEIKGALAAIEIEERRCKIQREEQDMTRC